MIKKLLNLIYEAIGKMSGNVYISHGSAMVK